MQRRPPTGRGGATATGALWVANSADDTVTRIDPDTNATVFTVPVGDEPVAVAVGAGGVWVANAGDGTVSRIDPTPNEVVGTIEVGNPPAGIAVARWCRLGERAVLLGTTGAGTSLPRSNARPTQPIRAETNVTSFTTSTATIGAVVAGEPRIERSVGATSRGTRERCGVSQSGG